MKLLEALVKNTMAEDSDGSLAFFLDEDVIIFADKSTGNTAKIDPADLPDWIGKDWQPLTGNATKAKDPEFLAIGELIEISSSDGILSLSAYTKSDHPLDELAGKIRQINRDNGWNVVERDDWNGDDKYKISSCLALIHSEVSEALEAYRNGDLSNFCEEMADTVIRVLDLVRPLCTSFDAVVGAKLQKNRTRGYRHGGKRV